MPKPRTPRYFPTMKVRGARRRRLAPFQRLHGSFERLGVTADQASRAMQTLSRLTKREEEQ